MNRLKQLFTFIALILSSSLAHAVADQQAYRAAEIIMRADMAVNGERSDLRDILYAVAEGGMDIYYGTHCPAGRYAYVNNYSNPIYICPLFDELSFGQQVKIILHEMGHLAGYDDCQSEWTAEAALELAGYSHYSFKIYTDECW